MQRIATDELADIKFACRDAHTYQPLLQHWNSLDRVLFIHIPKCGGTSVRKALVSDIQCVPVPEPSSESLTQANFLMAEASKPGSPERQLLQKFVAAEESGEQQAKFFRRLAVFVAVTEPSRIFMLGHRSARELQPLFRAGSDQFVTTIREPLQVARSLAAYRVYRIMQGGAAASRLLKAMNLDLQRFEALLKNDPRELVRLMMLRESPSLCAALSFGNDATAAAVWADLRNSRCCIAHSSEQAQMLQCVFGRPVNNYSENTSVGREGSGANFAAILEDEWLAPFIDPQDSLLYERFNHVGLIGFWQGGGSLEDYHELLASH